MPEWVINASAEPIPKPYRFEPKEIALLHDLQRRSHLEAFDHRYQRMPLDDAEKEALQLLEYIVKEGTLVMFRGVELRFAPGEMWEVPNGTAAKIASFFPGKLVALGWQDVRDKDLDGIRKIHFETPEENIRLAIVAAERPNWKRDPVTMSVEDGMLQLGDGEFQGLPAGWNKPVPRA